MNVILSGIGRLFAILVGYAVASVAASAMLTILFTASLALPSDLSDAVFHGPLLLAIPIVALFVAYFAGLPSAVLILMAEIWGKRDWLFYALGGGGVSIAVIGYMWQAGYDPTDAAGNQDLQAASEYYLLVAEPAVAATLIAAGICGGIAYWLVSGRTAGGWRSSRDSAPHA